MIRWISGLIVALLLLISDGAAASAPFEFHGYLSFIEADHQGFIEHRYVWNLEPGAGIRAELESSFEPYLEIVDEGGNLLARSDDDVDSHVARLRLDRGDGGPYYIRVTSTSSDETGAYTLRLWPAPESFETIPDVEPPRPAIPIRTDIVDRGTWIEGEIQSGVADFASQIDRYVIPVANDGGLFDVWLFSDHDFDLYGAVLDGGSVVLDSASRRAYGYEHVRLIAMDGAADSIAIHVALFEPWTDVAPYHLLVRRQDVNAPMDVGPGEVASLSGVRQTPYAGRLTAGERVWATIHPSSFTTQSWTFYIPPGTRRFEIGVFDADRDLELSVEPGWSPSPYGMEHGIRSATRRWNDRIVVDGRTGDLPSGIYTAAVWPSGAESQAEEHSARGRGESSGVRYSIQLAVDGVLPPSAAYAGFTPEATRAMPGPERARLATVWIESGFHWGVGGVVSPEGLILTSYSAVYDCHPDLLAPIGCIEDGADLQSFEFAEEHLVWMVDPGSGLAKQQFVAEVIATHPQHDLALLAIVHDVDGNPPPNFANGEEHFFPYLNVDLGALSDGDGDLGRSPGPPLVVALGFPEGAWSGGVAAHPVVPSDVTVHDGPIPLLEIGGRDPHWRSGALLVAPEHGVLLGLIAERHRVLWAEEAWVAVPTELVPSAWLTSNPHEP